MSLSFATVDSSVLENDEGIEVSCVYATCVRSKVQVGPIWGDGPRSVRRALAELSEQCECGATFHRGGEVA